MAAKPKGKSESKERFDESLLQHAVRCWDAERENASRLSGRSTLILSALAALFGLGLFKVEWFRGDKDVPRVPMIAAQWAIRILMSGSLVCFGLALTGLIRRSGKSVSRRTTSKSLASIGQGILRLLPSKKIPHGSRRHYGEVWTRRLRAIAIRLTRPRSVMMEVQEEPSRSSEVLRLPETVFKETPATPDLARKLVFIRVYEAYLHLSELNNRKEKHLEKAQQFFLFGLFALGAAILAFIFLTR